MYLIAVCNVPDRSMVAKCQGMRWVSVRTWWCDCSTAPLSPSDRLTCWMVNGERFDKSNYHVSLVSYYLFNRPTQFDHSLSVKVKNIVTLTQVSSWCKKYDSISFSRVPNSNAHAARAGSSTEYVVDTTSWEGSVIAFNKSSQQETNLLSSSVKATITPRDRVTACLTLSALSSVSICLSMERTKEPRSSACVFVSEWGGWEWRKGSDAWGGWEWTRIWCVSGENGARNVLCMRSEGKWEFYVTPKRLYYIHN